MPYVWEPNAEALTHRGITVYHVHKNDGDVLRKYWYALSDSASDCGDEGFDVRAYTPIDGGPEDGFDDHGQLLAHMVDELITHRERSFLWGYGGEDVLNAIQRNGAL